MAEREDECIPLYVTLTDKLGDNGLISVVILRQRPPVMEIDSWLMSCRVLGRGVEQYAMNQVVALAQARACEVLVGAYIPTAKNGMVNEFYQQFGFERGEEREDGATVWRLRVSAYQAKKVCMKEAA